MKKANIKQHGIKTAKGYRLKPSTHKLVKKVQHKLNTSQDTVISRAVKLLQKKLRSKTIKQ